MIEQLNIIREQIEGIIASLEKKEPAAWEPKVGERVIDTELNVPGYIKSIEHNHTWPYRVQWDSGYVLRSLCQLDHLRPETREDREARARKIVAKAKPGDRFRVIERPVEASAFFGGREVTATASQPENQLKVRVEWQPGSPYDIYAWNLVPLPAEEPKRWEWIERMMIYEHDVNRPNDDRCIVWSDGPKPITRKDVGAIHDIVKPLAPDAEVAELKRALLENEDAIIGLDKRIVRLSEKVRNQRRELAKRNEEVEAMREFFEPFASFGPENIPYAFRTASSQMGGWHGLYNLLHELADRYQRVLDAREGKE